MHTPYKLISTLIMLATLEVLAIETTQVELREGAVNDGIVRITRSGNELVFQDQVAGTVTLSTINQVPTTHSTLQNLTNDDHPQYHNDARHLLSHSAGFNALLLTPPDANGNTTLGAHVSDSSIHLNSEQNESILGFWEFTNSLIVSKSPLILRNETAADGFSILFETNQGDGELRYSALDQQFEMESLQTADITASTASINDLSVTEIQGIEANNLLDASANEDVTGSWDFLNELDIIVSNTSTLFNEQGAEVRYFPFIESLGVATDNRTRSGLKAQATLTTFTDVSLNDTLLFAVEGDATVETTTNNLSSGLSVGVGGIASTKQGTFDAIGVVGVTRFALDANSRRVGILGAENDDLFSMRDLIPEGNHAGVFLGDVSISESLTVDTVTGRNIAIGPFITGSDFTAGQPMEWSTAGTLVLAGAQSTTAVYAGVAANSGISGDECTLIVHGVVLMPVTDAVNQGDRLTWDGNYVAPYASGDARSIGTSLGAFNGTGNTQISVFVQPQFHP
ncbi:MAG: DUF2190 family protein [Sumerlaeia bacterium]